MAVLCCCSGPEDVATRKKQQLSIGPCKSLPNSPSHSSVCSAQVAAAVHISQVGTHRHTHTHTHTHTHKYIYRQTQFTDTQTKWPH
ncbi:unnamed protein product [Oncorhynchus mykiss]|uniref:Uncharacterized protein n=1 Tax=Oncorhynchus mykiss TaxID=8022 RepID=A0A060Z251_ONCMY|nr:unnamed protein product [Oncorhynchus mykiss]